MIADLKKLRDEVEQIYKRCFKGLEAVLQRVKGGSHSCKKIQNQKCPSGPQMKSRDCFTERYQLYLNHESEENFFNSIEKMLISVDKKFCNDVCMFQECQ